MPRHRRRTRRRLRSEQLTSSESPAGAIQRVRIDFSSGEIRVTSLFNGKYLKGLPTNVLQLNWFLLFGKLFR